jgi:hypothetical protein
MTASAHGVERESIVARVVPPNPLLAAVQAMGLEGISPEAAEWHLRPGERGWIKREEPRVLTLPVGSGGCSESVERRACAMP